MSIRIRLLILVCFAALALVGCDSGSDPLLVLDSQRILDNIQPDDPCGAAKSAAIGKWVKVVNSADSPPGNPTINFFSYNQPSINADGQLVFRARAKGPSGELAQGEASVLSGIWTKDLCRGDTGLTTIADRTTLVPDPNSNGATFNEFPSIPRIDAFAMLMATRGNHEPVETIMLSETEETKAGSNGIYTYDSVLKTGMTVLGNFDLFSVYAVPGVEPGIKFDVFPGSPAVTDGRFIAFKGNYGLPIPGQTAEPVTMPQTGVFYRDLQSPTAPAVLVANSATLIPNSGNVTFGSTAPPSAGLGQMVFAGYDDEDNPSLGGLYLAPLSPQPTLVPLIEVGSVVPDANGQPLAGNPTFTRFGEALSFDGRFMSFWGSWGTQTREVILECPEDGNKELIDYCMNNSPLPGGKTPVNVPLNQGIFLQDTATGLTRLVARAGTGAEFYDFLFWNYSGRPPGKGGGDEEDAEEPPRWRNSAFCAVDGNRGVVFKGVKTPGTGVAANGIYAVASATGTLSQVFKVLEVGDPADQVDPMAPEASIVTEVGIEREAVRDGWFTLNAGFTNAGDEGWAGVYATFVPDFSLIEEINADSI
jgi:hypothetical protein